MGSFSVIKSFLKEQGYKQIFYNTLGQYRPLRHTLKEKNRYYQKISEPFYKIMYDILNINEDKPTAQQTWNNL